MSKPELWKYDPRIYLLSKYTSRFGIDAFVHYSLTYYGHIAQKGNDRSPEEQLDGDMNIIRNSKRPSHMFLSKVSSSAYVVNTNTSFV